MKSTGNCSESEFESAKGIRGKRNGPGRKGGEIRGR